MRYLLSLLLLVMLSPLSYAVEAQTIDTSDLTIEQKLQVQQQIEQMKKRSSAVQIREEVSEWGKLGANLGVAMVAAAKELGVAASDFAKTPLGMVIIALVIFKLVGKFVLGIMAGLFVIWLGWRYLRFVTEKNVRRPIYEYRPILWGALQRRVQVGYDEIRGGSADQITGGHAVFVISSISGVITVIAFIANM